MDWWKLTPIIISIIALIFSISTFFYNFFRNKKNLNVELLKYFNVPTTGTFVKLILINKSANPISITKFSINEKEANRNKDLYIKWDTRLNNVNIDVLPIKLESYEAVEVLLFFYNLELKSNEKDKYIIYSSRGKITKRINNKNMNKNYHELISN